MKNNKLVLVIIGFVAYFVSAGISYSMFSKYISASPTDDTSSSVATGKQANDYEAIEFDQTKPKTEECPLNGVKYSKDQKKWWEQHRPLGIMIENHEDSRPQSGLSSADV